MLKKYVHLIPALLLFITCACQTHPRQGVQPPLTKSEIVYSSSEDFSAIEKRGEVDEDVWDTSDVNISEIDKNRKLIAFTFDDAPSKTMENILAVFAAFNEKNPDCKASATFFFNGRLFDNHSLHLAHAALALGCELGNHTHAHADLTKLTKEEISQEIDKTDAILSKIDGKPRHLLRAPFGRINEQVKSLAPVPIVDWTIDTLDWTGCTAENIYDEVFGNLFSGAIVLMHDGYEHTVSALKLLLPALKANGYQVVSVSKMSKAHACPLRRGSVYIRARRQK